MARSRWRHILWLIVAFLLAAPTAWGRVHVSVDVGWSQRYRLEHWTPIFVTVHDDQGPRNVMLDLRVPLAADPIRISTACAITPTPSTFVLYAPLSYSLENAILTVRDPSSAFRVLALSRLDPDPMAFRYQTTDANGRMIGVSGKTDALRILEKTSGTELSLVGHLAPNRLPAVAMGYQCLDWLVLNQPDLNDTSSDGKHIAYDRQRAILEWVRSGGNLLIWPGADPVPTDSPITMALPVGFGPNQQFQLSLETRRSAGLMDLSAQLRGRELVVLDESAERVNLLDGKVIGFRRWLGLGQIVVLPIDASALAFETSERAAEFWSPMLWPAPPVKPTNVQRLNWWDAQRNNVIYQAMDTITQNMGIGDFGFSYVAMLMIGLMLIVGPIDWFVLKKLGRQAWTWVTTTGWILLITFGAVYAGSVMRSGDLHLRTMRLVDETDGAVISQVDLVGMYSPQNDDYDLGTDPHSWWQPPSVGVTYSSRGSFNEIPLRQNSEGTIPRNMRINIWSLRFLQGQQLFGGSTMGAPASIESQLTITRIFGKTPRVSGSIKYLGTTGSLRGIVVQSGDEVAIVKDEIASGQSITIDQPLLPLEEQSSAAQMSWPPDPNNLNTFAMGGLAPLQLRQIDYLMRQRPDIACVYAEVKNPPAPLKLANKQPLEQHWRVIRSTLQAKLIRE